MNARRSIETALKLVPRSQNGVYAMNNGVCVVNNPAREYNPDNTSEPRYMILMPDIERYTDDLDAAIRMTENKREIERLRKKGEEAFRKAFPGSEPF